LTEAVIERSCLCEQNVENFKKNDEYLLLLLKISSVRIVSTLQNIAHHINGRWKLFEKVSKYFPRLFNQSAVIDSIDALIDNIRYFITTNKEVEKMVQKFFIQLISPTFLCITTGPCKSVSQSYANCLQNNSPFWRAFFGMEPGKISAILWQTVMKYPMEVEVVNNSCIIQHANMITSCSSICIPMKKEMNDYCSDDCKHAMHECLHENASDWDSFISILQKLTINFDKVKILCTRRPVSVLRPLSPNSSIRCNIHKEKLPPKCGRINFAKTPDTIRHIDYQKPDPISLFLSLSIESIRKYCSEIFLIKHVNQ
uniref:Uncharacterized protein n=1 Tax=Wuchereria bancrofti TaxID=6293 RepID=A0A1I8ESH2_WUCBA